MASRYYHVEDDRELDVAPEFVPCDGCGLLVAITDEDEDEDETVLCLTCANQKTRAVRKTA